MSSAGVPAVRLLPAQLSVQLADADVGIAAVIVADPVQFLLCVRIGMLAVRTMGFWDKRFLCAIIQLIPAHERSFGDVIPAAHQADIFCLTVQFDTINLCCDFVGQISLVLFLLLCYDGHGD